MPMSISPSTCADLEFRFDYLRAEFYSLSITFRLPLSDALIDLLDGSRVEVKLDESQLRALSLDNSAYGQRLADMVFDSRRVAQAFHSARSAAHAQSLPLRMRLCFESLDTPIHAIRWELLCDPDGKPLAISERVLLSRFVPSSDLAPYRPPYRPSLQTLIAAVAPHNLGDFRLATFDASITAQSTAAAFEPGDITVLASSDAPVTLARLAEHLRNGQDLCCLIAHGAIVNDEPMLFLEDATGQTEPVTAGQIHEQLSALSQLPRLLILLSCEGAGDGTYAAFAALGPRLARLGVPAIIAIQGQIKIAAATEFLSSLMRELRRDGVIDRALAAARASIRTSADWWRPVLFMRLESGRLWRSDKFDEQSGGVHSNSGLQLGPSAPRLIPALPPHYVPIPHILDSLREVLTKQVEGTSVALYGMGGSGKSTLSMAVGYDSAIQEQFPDGVIWVSVGRDAPSVTEQLQIIGTALGDAPGYYTSEQAGAHRLKTILQERAVLIILDDIWETRAVEPFLTSATRSRVLFTTRDRTIVIQMGALEMPIELPRQDQSVAILKGWAGREDPDLAAVADRLGNLPLALKLVGALLREGVSASYWLKQFRKVTEIRLSRRAVDPYENLESCFDLSIALVIEADRQFFYSLGIFAASKMIPKHIILRLWQCIEPRLTPVEADELAIEFNRLALLTRDSATGSLRLHDLLLGYAHDKLGINASKLHRNLLDSYNPKGVPWPQVADDGYLYDHLGHHLIGAGARDEFIHLLIDDPSWLNRRTFGATFSPYIADVRLALGLYSDPLESSAALELVQLHTAYQVAHSSAGSIDDHDLEILIWLNQVDEALSAARLRIDAKERFSGLLIIYRTLIDRNQPTSHLRDELFARSAEQSGVLDRLKALVEIARCSAIAGDADGLELAWSQFQQNLAQSRPSASLSGVFQSVELIRIYEIVRAETIDDVTIASWIENAFHTAPAHWFNDSLFPNLIEGLVKHGWAQQVWSMINSVPEEHHLFNNLERLSMVAICLHQGQQTTIEALALSKLRDLALGQNDKPVIQRALALALAGCGKYEEARTIAFSFDDTRDRDEIVVALATSYFCHDQASEAYTLLHDCYPFYDVRYILVVLRLIIELSNYPGLKVSDEFFLEFSKVLKFYNFSEKSFKGQYLIPAAHALQKSGQYHQVSILSGFIEHSDAYGDLIVEQIVQLAEQRFEEAKQLVESLTQPAGRTRSLQALALAQAKRGAIKQAAYIFAELQQARTRNDRPEHEWTVLPAIAILLHQKEFSEAADLAFELTNQAVLSKAEERDALLSYQSIAYATIGCFPQAHAVAMRIHLQVHRQIALHRVATAAAQARALGVASEIAQDLGEGHRQCSVLCEIALEYLRWGKTSEAAKLLEDVADQIFRLREHADRTEWLFSDRLDPARSADARLIQTLMRCGLNSEATRLATGTGLLAVITVELARQGDLDETERYLRTLREIADVEGLNLAYHKSDWTTDDAVRELARALSKAGRIDEARETIEMISTESNRVQALCLAAIDIYPQPQAQIFIQEAEHLLQSLEKGQDSEDARLTLITAHAVNERLAQALAELGPIPLQEYLAALLNWFDPIEQQFPQIGTALLQHVLRIAGWSGQHWKKLSEALARGIAPQQAQEQIASITLAPSILPVGQRLSQILQYSEARGYYFLEEYSKTCALCDELLDANPDIILGYELRAQARAALGAYSSALSDLDRSLELTPVAELHWQQFFERTLIHIAAGNYLEARHELEKILGRWPSQETFLRQWQAVIGLLSGHYDRAISDSAAALASGAPDGVQYYWHALYYLAIADYPSAEGYLQRSLELDPQDDSRAHIRFWQGVIYSCQGKLERSKVVLDEAANLSQHLSRQSRRGLQELLGIFQGDAHQVLMTAQTRLADGLDCRRLINRRRYANILAATLPNHAPVHKLADLYCESERDNNA